MTPEEFTKEFAGAFGRHDAAGLAALLASDADVLTLSGALTEGAAAAEAAFAAEFAGIFAASRLVTGKLRQRPIGPGGAVITQRFVVSGARDAQGQEMPRFAAVLSLVILAQPEGWRAVSLTFCATA